MLNKLGLKFHINQDINSFEELYKPLKYKIHLICLYNHLTNADAELLTDEIVCQVYRKIDIFNPSFKFNTWIGVICRNYISKFYKQKQKQSSFNIEDLDLNLIAPDEADTTDYDQMLLELLLDINEPYRSIIYRKYYGREKLQDLADEYGINISTLKTNMYLRIRKLSTKYENGKKRLF